MTKKSQRTERGLIPEVVEEAEDDGTNQNHLSVIII